uniref:INT n=1 Tax=Spodoptera frugiperda TaxID=7108 RepID=A0A2U7Q8V3_SPOFR|nr:INT [Spodoptera frugiperda]DAC81443.1 TPA_asm: integrase [Spodoptera moth adintovirus 1]
MSKQQIVNEIHKTARRNFLRRSVVLKGIDDLWQADLMDMQNLRKYNKGYNYILIVIDCFSKYAWTRPLKSKNKLDVTHAFERILLDSHRKPDNLQTDMGTEFYNNAFQALMKTYKINHYSSFSTKKASIVERLIKTIKNKLYKYFSLHGNYKWLGKPLEVTLESYNNTKHRTIKLKPIDVCKSNEQIIKENILKANKHVSIPYKPKFKIGDYVRISKYKHNFEKGYTPNWSTELFTVKKINNTIPVTYHIQDQRKQAILGTFYEQELQKSNYPGVYLIEKVLRKKGKKLYVKWLGLNNNENSWIDKTALVD